MSAFHTLSSNFNGGLMTPKMGGRFDLDKLRSGCIELKNMLVSPYGGVFKRPGTQFVEKLNRSLSTQTRLLSLRVTGLDIYDTTRTVTETVVFVVDSASMKPIQFGDVMLQAWSSSTKYINGDIVGIYNAGTDKTTVYYCIEDHTSGASFDSTKWSNREVKDGDWIALIVDLNIPVPNEWFNYGMDKLRTVQINDLVFFAHPESKPYRLVARDGQLDTAGSTSRFKYRIEPVPFDFAPALDVNETLTNVQVQYDYSSWATSVSYAVGDRVIGTDGKLYTCYSAHTSGSTTAPITGASYLTRWNPGTS
jgi:hypothetical protein